MSEAEHQAIVRQEFERAAEGFAKRTRGRFDHLNVLGFSRVQPGATVLEVGAGTGNFISIFEHVAGSVIAADLTPGMLRVAREQHPALALLVADGARLPLGDRTIDLATSAHAVHHIPDPVPVFRELARVTADGGRVMVVDIAAPEDPGAARRMNEVMLVRDPSHATAYTPGALCALIERAGLRVVDQAVVDRIGHVSNWMSPGEYPPERIEAVHRYVAEHWRAIGMGMEPDGDDFTYVDHRTMILAEPG